VNLEVNCNEREYVAMATALSRGLVLLLFLQGAQIPRPEIHDNSERILQQSLRN
jgi:hypothetical protein